MNFKPILAALVGALMCAGAGAWAQDWGAAGSGTRENESIAVHKPTAEQAARCAKVENEQRRKGCLSIYSVAGLKFPDRVETASAASTRMAILKPEGPGPFPAVILLHSCASLPESENMAYWGTELLKAGYVVFIVDSWHQRGFGRGVCAPTKALPVNVTFLRVRDAYDALDHLSRFDVVDKGRIAALGASQGGRAVYLLTSAGIAETYAPSPVRFAALVALYAECFNRTFKTGVVPPDPDRPLLALLGDRDEDGDPKMCVPRFEQLKAAGAPYEWHVFPNIGHVWDEPKFADARYVEYYAAPSGRVWYAYDADVTAQSRARVLAFLAARMHKK